MMLDRRKTLVRRHGSPKAMRSSSAAETKGQFKFVRFADRVVAISGF